MVEIRYAATKLVEMIGAVQAERITFKGGSGVVLESLKISRNHASRDWKPEECPTLTDETRTALLSRPLIHLKSLPVDLLAIAVDGTEVSYAHIDLSAGCRAGGEALNSPPVAVRGARSGSRSC